MLNLSLKELKVELLSALNCLMSEDELLSALNLSETNFSKARIEKIRKEFNESRQEFSK